MAQIKYFDKRVGITYIYDSESYYDPELRQSRSRRKLIGKLDPETGEMIPTGPKGRPTKKPKDNTIEAKRYDVDYEKKYNAAMESIAIKEEKIASLEKDLRESKADAARLRNRLKKIVDLCVKDSDAAEQD